MIGACALELPDGTVLTAPSDLQLAWAWAAYAHGAAWDGLTYGQQCATVALALSALQGALQEASALN